MAGRNPQSPVWHPNCQSPARQQLTETHAEARCARHYEWRRQSHPRSAGTIRIRLLLNQSSIVYHQLEHLCKLHLTGEIPANTPPASQPRRQVIIPPLDAPATKMRLLSRGTLTAISAPMLTMNLTSSMPCREDSSVPRPSFQRAVSRSLSF